MQGGKILGIVPKTYMPNYAEFYEQRQFSSGRSIEQNAEINISGVPAPFGTGLVFAHSEMPEYTFGIEICEDIWAAAQPSERLCRGGAHIMINPSASNEIIGKAVYRRTLVLSTSARLLCGYIYVSSGSGESTQDLVYSGHCIIAENGTSLAENKPFEEKELDKLLASARLNSLALTAMCHVSLPYMTSGSSIVNMGSNSAWQPVPYQAVYGASKSYVLSLSRALWRELRAQGIHVMCVCPGWIKTEFQQAAQHDKYIRYVDKWYGPDEVAAQAMKDLGKKKLVSILGHPVRRQVRLVKFLPVKLVMSIWCKQQNIK